MAHLLCLKSAIMKTQVLTIFESLLLIRGLTRVDITSGYSTDKEIRITQRVLIKMLQRIVSDNEIKNIIKLKQLQLNELMSEPMNTKEIKIYNVCWDLYIQLMHEQIATNSLNYSLRKFLNPFSAFFIKGIS